MSGDGRAGLMPPPMHPLHPSAPPSPAARSTSSLAPPLPPRPGSSSSNVHIDVDQGSSAESDSDSGSGFEFVPVNRPITPNLGAGPSTESVLSTKEEEELSEVQLRELYDDEEIDRFLYLFSTYVREVRIAEPPPPSPGHVAVAASMSAPAVPQAATAVPSPPSSRPPEPSSSPQPRTISELIAQDFLIPLLPRPRAPLPDFTLSRVKHSAQRLYVTVEPVYSLVAVPLLKLATWKDTKRSFGYCALYWILWYHGLLLSAFMGRLLYELIIRKLHPYPSLTELREYRSRIDRSETFGRILVTRLAASPALGLRDVWDLFGDYRHTRKAKKAKKKESAGKDEPIPGLRTGEGEDANVHGAEASVADLTSDESSSRERQEEADLKRLGLFLLNEVADVLERVKNIFLWRQPGASVYYGVLFLGWLIVGLLPARYLARLVGLLAGGFFWHAIPVIAAIPESERNRMPSPLNIVPTDTEYAMDLISQRVARGLPVRPKRRRRARGGSDPNVVQTRREGTEGKSSSVDWNKWGDRIASTKERAGEFRQIFRDGQWKQTDTWKALVDSPLAPRVAPPDGSELRIDSQTFPAQLKKNPGLITLTQRTLFFTPLLASHPTLTVPLTDITGVKKTGLTKGVDLYYTDARPDGTKEAKTAGFMLVGSRSELFARLVSWGGQRWAKV